MQHFFSRLHFLLSFFNSSDITFSATSGIQSDTNANVLSGIQKTAGLQKKWRGKKILSENVHPSKDMTLNLKNNMTVFLK